jgi:hypothetical protein
MTYHEDQVGKGIWVLLKAPHAPRKIVDHLHDPLVVGAGFLELFLGSGKVKTVSEVGKRGEGTYKSLRSDSSLSSSSESGSSRALIPSTPPAMPTSIIVWTSAQGLMVRAIQWPALWKGFIFFTTLKAV